MTSNKPEGGGLEFVLAELDRRRGHWPEIAAASGVAYHTLTKIAYGKIREPGTSKIEALAKYFREHQEAA